MGAVSVHLKLIRPELFPKLAFIPKPFEDFNLRFQFIFQNDTNDIVTEFYQFEPKGFPVHSRRSGDLPLLTQINCRDGRSKFIGRARFDFDKT